MENFIVSARKYRPATFDTVIGQHSITSTLKNAIRNQHIAHAFLFCGPRGVGKTTCARILAKTINCQNISANVEACNLCESCTSFNTSHSFNIHELDAASKNKVDDIHSLIEQVRIAPQVGRYSIYIIDEVHMLSVQAFNAFLKTLEEPPSYAIFILATTSKQKIIPTILSRCQIFDFNRISVEDIAKHLADVAAKESVTADSDALHIIAQKSDGSLRDALSLFDQMVSFSGTGVSYKHVIETLNILDYDYYFKVIDCILNNNISSSLILFDKILENGFDGHDFISGLAEHIRNLLICKDEVTLQLLQVGEKNKEKYKIQAGECGSELLLDALNISNQCDISYNSGINKRLQVELALMQLCSISKTIKQVKTVSILPPPLNKEEINVQEPKPLYKKPLESKKSSHDNALINQVSDDHDNKKDPIKEQNVQQNLTNETKKDGFYNPRTLSLKNLKKPKVQESTAEINDKQAINETDKPENIVKYDLEKAWNSYAGLIREKGKFSLYSTLTTRKPYVKENNIIEFAIDNSVQEKELNGIKTELHEFLRKELRNPLLKVETVKIKAGEEKKPYTSIEKFQRMAEKNPNIEKFRQQLNLDINI